MVGTGVGHLHTQPLMFILNNSSKYDSSKDAMEGTRARRVLGA